MNNIILNKEEEKPYLIETLGDRKGVFKVTMTKGKYKSKSVIFHEMPLSLAYFNNKKCY